MRCFEGWFCSNLIYSFIAISSQNQEEGKIAIKKSNTKVRFSSILSRSNEQRSDSLSRSLRFYASVLRLSWGIFEQVHHLTVACRGLWRGLSFSPHKGFKVLRASCSLGCLRAVRSVQLLELVRRWYWRAGLILSRGRVYLYGCRLQIRVIGRSSSWSDKLLLVENFRSKHL